MNGYKTIVPWYRSIFHSWKHCDGNYVTHFPMNMRPSDLQRLVIEAYDRIYGPREIVRAVARRDRVAAVSKFLHYYSWQDVRQNMVNFIPFLEEREEGVYDDDGRLLEDALIARVEKDSRWTFHEGNRTVEALGLTPLEMPVPRSRNITCVPPNSKPSRVGVADPTEA
jgi:hypothetical protein